MTFRRGPEYSPVYKIGSGLAIAGLALTSCRAEVSPTITDTPFSTQPRSTEVLPTAPPYPEGIAPGVVQEAGEIRAAFGAAVGAGGLGEIVPIFNDETLQESLNASGLAPILGPEIGGSRVITQIGHQNGGRRACFPNMPAELFNPNVATGRDDRLEANNLIEKYGEGLLNEETGELEIIEVRFQGLGAISLEQTPQDIICVNAVINTLDNPFDSPLGKVLNVIMDTDGNIYGTLPAIYSADQQVRIDLNNGGVYVGTEKVWEIGDAMAELTGSIVATPDYLGMGVPANVVSAIEVLSERGTDISLEPTSNKDEFAFIITNGGVKKEAGYIDTENDTVSLTTAKSEPVTVSAEQVVQGDDSLSIVIDQFQNKILQLRNGEWVSDKLLYLAAGRDFVRYSDWQLLDYPEDIEGDGLPTAIHGEFIEHGGIGVYSVTGVLVDVLGYTDQEYPNNLYAIVGFYDKNGELHSYEAMIGGDSNTATGFCALTANASQCWVATASEIDTHIKDWLASSNTRQFYIDIQVSDDRDTTLARDINKYKDIHDKLIKAIQTGDNFPEPEEDYFFRINIVRLQERMQ